MARALMIQGTGSHVGKSIMVAGLCRAFSQRGFRVRPFKPQNMSNNAAACRDGEISRAQALQAQACGVEPSTDMNPVLLKPESESGAQIIVQGERHATLSAREYVGHKPALMKKVCESYRRLAGEADIVLVEGAGSPAEVNLRRGDLANMGFARQMKVPVVLVADIERGGTIAQLVGTRAVISGKDNALIKGFIINKFRGDPTLFEDGYRFIEHRTAWRGVGIVPWFADAWRLPAEDAQDLARIRPRRDGLRIVCLGLSRIANFDDLDPLRLEPHVSVSLLGQGQVLPGNVDLVIIPGTKSTRSDLEFLRRQGWDIDLKAHLRRGGRVLGICGGFQMLGRMINDPHGIEGSAGATPGLGLLDVETCMSTEKTVSNVTVLHRGIDRPVDAYEIHIGRTAGPDRGRPFAHVMEEGGPVAEGAVSADGQVAGTYLHGLFADDRMRGAFLGDLGATGNQAGYRQLVETTLDDLASHLASCLDLDRLYRMTRN